MAVFFKVHTVASASSEPATGRIIGAVGLLIVLFVAAFVLKNNVSWPAPAETMLTCAEILFAAVVALFGFEGTKFLK